MSELIKQYLTEYLAWAEADAPVHETLNPDHPICSNARLWARAGKQETRLASQGVDDANQMVCELKDMFVRDDMDIWFPFGEATFTRECRFSAHHRNPDRLAWVRKQLGVV